MEGVFCNLSKQSDLKEKKKTTHSQISYTPEEGRKGNTGGKNWSSVSDERFHGTSCFHLLAFTANFSVASDCAAHRSCLQPRVRQFFFVYLLACLFQHN